MKNELVEYLSDMIEACGYSLPTVEIEAHAREIIEIVTKVDDQKIYDLMDSVNINNYTRKTVKNMIKSLLHRI